MKWFLLFLISVTVVTVNSKQFNREDIEDNEFADFEEFEEFEDDGKQVKQEAPPTPAPTVVDDDEEDEAIVEEEGTEFDHFHDSEEFEGYSSSSNQPHSSSSPQPEIKIAKVPMFQSKQWDNYVMELMILTGLAVYILNFLYGRAKNVKIAQTWFDVHRQILEENFSLVGDDGKKEVPGNGVGLVKESEHVYTLWCSGRVCCEGMLVELKMIKRQDLVSMVAQFFRKNSDVVEIKCQMGSDDMDTFVTFAGQKRCANKVSKEMNDLVTYGGEKKTGDKYNLPSNFVVLSEIGEATQAVLDARVQAIINKYPEMIEYVHVSDQYSGPKSSDDGGQPVRLPEGKRVVRVGVNFPSFAPGRVKMDEVESMKPVLLLVFYLVEKMKRFKLSKESKQKAERNRARVEESFLKTTHQVRAQAAAERREERRRMEKERIMAEEDPDKQRRWEEKETRRQAKKRQPRIKQLKVKAL